MSLSSSLKDALWSLKKNRAATVTVLVILILGIAALSGYVLFGGGGPIGNKTVQVGRDVNANTNGVSLTRRMIDGVPVPTARANAFPVAVVVENLVASRPQAGLDRANVVYEMLAEGGITRFVAI